MALTQTESAVFGAAFIEARAKHTLRATAMLRHNADVGQPVGDEPSRLLSLPWEDAPFLGAYQAWIDAVALNDAMNIVGIMRAYSFITPNPVDEYIGPTPVFDLTEEFTNPVP